MAVVLLQVAFFMYLWSIDMVAVLTSMSFSDCCVMAVVLLQVVFFMYLWSIDMDAVLTSMSCFRLLCEEAEIRCGADEMAVTQLLPNSAVYEELAAASTVLTTGNVTENL